MQWNIIFIKPMVNFSINGPQGVCIHTWGCGWACHLNTALQAQLFSQSYIQRAWLNNWWLAGINCLMIFAYMANSIWDPNLHCPIEGHGPLLRRFPIYICCIDFGSLHLVDKYTTCFCCTFCQTCLLIFVFLNHNYQLTIFRTFHFVSHIGCFTIILFNEQHRSWVKECGQCISHDDGSSWEGRSIVISLIGMWTISSLSKPLVNQGKRVAQNLYSDDVVVDTCTLVLSALQPSLKLMIASNCVGGERLLQVVPCVLQHLCILHIVMHASHSTIQHATHHLLPAWVVSMRIIW